MTKHEKRQIFPFLPAHHSRVLMLFALLIGIVFLVTLVFYSVLAFRLYLLWNIFLAALPLFFALLLAAKERGRIAKPLFWLLWLLFFPNAPYMLTDFIHISRYSFYRRDMGFLPDPAAWLGLLHLTLGIAAGCTLGMASLFFIQARLRQAKGVRAGRLLVCGVSLLSGAAIYVGRFLRFNSWDVLANLPNLLRTAAESLVHLETWLLCLVFAVMTLLFYLPVHLLLDHPTQAAEQNKHP